MQEVCIVPYNIRRNNQRPGETAGLFDLHIMEPGIPMDIKDDKVLLSPSEQHCMVVGSSGRGKTRRVVYPSVILSARAGHSLIVADPKGEIYRHCSDEIRKCGLAVRVLNLRNPECGDRWSPLTLVQQYWNSGNRSRAMMLLKDIAELLTVRIISTKDGYWRMGAIDAFLGFSLLLLEKGLLLTFEAVHHMANEYMNNREVRNIYVAKLDKDEDSSRRLTTITSLDTDVTLGCVISTLNSAITPYVDQQDVRDLLLGSDDFELTDIGKRPTAFFVICPDESTAMYPLASMFIAQSYSELVHFADSGEQNTLPVRVDYVIDEFGSFLGSDWPSKLTAARSRGIRFVLAVQDTSQIVTRYGDDGAQTIMANCRVLEFLGGRDMRLMALLSGLAGYEPDEHGLDRPVLPVSVLASIDMGKAVVLDDSGKPRFGNLPDWTAWGINTKAELNTKKRDLLPYKVPYLSEVLETSDSDSGNREELDDDLELTSGDEEQDHINRLVDALVSLSDEIENAPGPTEELPF